MHNFHKSPARRWFLIVALAFAPALTVLFLQPVPVARGKVGPSPINTALTPPEQLAQELALADARVQAYAVGKRTEVFVIKQVGHQYTAPASACETADCRQVEIYNFDDNLTIAAIVNVETAEVLDVLEIKGARPGINRRLAQLAIDLIRHYPAVEKALGRIPEPQEIVPMEAGMVGTSCDLGHICAAGTLPMHDNILWVVVDLTEEKVVGLNWTRIGPEDTPPSYMQRQAQAPEDCTDAGAVNQDGWTMNYETTGADGFRIYNVRYHNTLVISNTKLVEWHADYGTSGYVDAVGCSPSGGFPIYPFGNTTTNTLIYSPTNEVVGFEVVRDFRMNNWGSSCNYRYEQHMQFFKDGRFRITGGAYGKGCGTNSLYRPIVRIDLAVNGDANDSWATWNGGGWQPQATEAWWLQDTTYTPEGYKWTVADGGGAGYYVMPNAGQFGYNGGDVPPITATNPLTDQAYVYLTLHKPTEGDTDLGAIGTCCRDDYQQGPHQFVNGEAVAAANLVVWYVPQMLTQANEPYRCWTVNTSKYYPCFGGPLFVPQAPTATLSHNGPVALGTQSLFTATLSNLLSPISYTWDLGDGTVITGSRLPNDNSVITLNHEYATVGDYLTVLTFTTQVNTTRVYQQLHTVGDPSPNFSVSDYGVVNNSLVFTNSTLSNVLNHMWNFGDGTVLATNAPVVTHAYADAGAYDVVLTATNGLSFGVITKTVHIGYLTTANFTGPTQSFVNQVAVFTNTSTTGTDPITYQWNFGDGILFTSSAPTVTHVYTNPGAYNVTLTAASPYGVSSASHPVNVPVPVSSNFLLADYGLVGTPVVFTNTTVGSATNHTWDFGDGVILSNMAAVLNHTYAAPGMYTVVLTSTNEVETSTIAKTVQIGYAPVASLTGPTSQVFVNTTVTFTNTSITGTAPITYQWNFGDGTLLTSSAPTVTHVYTNPGAYNVTLTAASPYGVSSASRPVNVFVPLSSNFLLAAYGLVGTPVVFTNTTVGSATNHTWDFGDGVILSNMAAVLTHTYAAPGMYTVVLTSTNQEEASTIAKTIQIGYAPVASFTGPTAQVLVNTTVTFTNTSITGTAPITYQWNFGDGMLLTSSDTTVAHSYANPGVYTVTLLATSPYGSHTISSAVNVGAPALASFNGPATALMHELVSFTNTSTGSGPITYQWNFGDGSAPSAAVHPSHRWTAPGTYTITLTATNANNAHTTSHIITILPNYLTYLPYSVK